MSGRNLATDEEIRQYFREHPEALDVRSHRERRTLIPVDFGEGYVEYVPFIVPGEDVPTISGDVNVGRRRRRTAARRDDQPPEDQGRRDEEVGDEEPGGGIGTGQDEQPPEEQRRRDEEEPGDDEEPGGGFGTGQDDQGRRDDEPGDDEQQPPQGQQGQAAQRVSFMNLFMQDLRNKGIIVSWPDGDFIDLSILNGYVNPFIGNPGVRVTKNSEPFLFLMQRIMRKMLNPGLPVSVNDSYSFITYRNGVNDEPYFSEMTLNITKYNKYFMEVIFLFAMLNLYGFNNMLGNTGSTATNVMFSIWYQQRFDTPSCPWGAITRIPGTIVRVTPNITSPGHRFIPLAQVQDLARNLYEKYEEDLMEPTTNANNQRMGYTTTRVVRDGSDEIVIMKINHILQLRLDFRAFAMARAGGRWKASFKPLIDSVFPKGIVIPTNETDNLCMIYCIIMGIAKIGMNSLFITPKYIDVPIITRRVMTARDIDASARNLLRCLQNREDHPLLMEIETTAHKKRSINELANLCSKIYDEYIGHESTFGLDVYYYEFSNARNSIIPIYSTKDKSTTGRISLLLMSFPNNEAHFGMISNLRQLYKKDERPKMFYTCSRCHETFFTREMLTTHQTRQDCDIIGGVSYAWNCKDHGDRSVGVCDRCHLKFSCQGDYEHHQHFCFLKQRSYECFVQLADDPYIETKEPGDLSEDDYIFFADFETYISNGEHKFLSYGVYSLKEGTYYKGYELWRFVEYIFKKSNELPTNKIYVCFHNAMGYDCNFIMRYLLESTEAPFDKCTFKLIMKSMNRMQALTVKYWSTTHNGMRHIIFRDTFQFLTLSLENLVNSTRTDSLEENMIRFGRFFRICDYVVNQEYGAMYHPEFPGVTPADINLILRKNLFPYRFFTSTDCLDLPLDQMKELFAPKEENLQYFSEDIIVDDLADNYPLFLTVCEKFDVKCMRDYHDLYLMCDVMELTDIFVNVMDSLKSTHKINLMKYIGMPSASWDAFVTTTPDLKLDTYSNTRFAEFFQAMVRGGVTSAPLRYAKADDTHSILYLDVNGLYPFVMQEYPYPTGDFEWVDVFPDIDPDATYNDWLILHYIRGLKESGRGACFCLDMHMDPRLKDKYDSFPLAPEHREIKDELMNGDGYYEFMEHWCEANEGEKPQTFLGLVGTMYPKDHYLVHYEILAWYIMHGMKVTKIHYAVTFSEGYYLRPYIRKNIALRNERSDDLGKTVYKLMSNSIYGKTFENPFNRGLYKIIKDNSKLTMMITRGDIYAMQPLTSEATLVKMNGQNVTLDKPTYIGACVTEYAKLHMYQLFYDKLMPLFSDKVELVYTDTDSFIIRVEHPSGWTPKDLFAFINYHMPGLIGKEGGKIKSETGEDDLIDEVIALRSKVYAYRTTKGKIGKRAKGTTKAAQKTQLGWEQYKQVLFELKTLPTVNYQFRKDAFHVSTIEMMKNSLSANDGKRYILPDGIHTRAWGNQ